MGIGIAASYANHTASKKVTGLGPPSLVEAEGEAQAGAGPKDRRRPRGTFRATSVYKTRGEIKKPPLILSGEQ